MNRKGGVFLTVFIALIIFLVGMLFVNFIYPQTQVALGTSGLSCDDTAISDGSKLSCLIVELVDPLWILSIISIVGGLIISRFI